MAIRSGFFNSINGDRKYGAERFAEYFASFIGNGVFPNPGNGLQVMANNDMTVTVKAGRAWINGYILINDDDYTLTLDPADGVLSRIDRIVVRYDIADREIRLEVKKGAFASSPVAPALQRDVDAYELGLADIAVNAGAVSINQADITDLRMNANYCGIVKGLVDQIDTTDLFAQFEDSFLTWFDRMKDQLSSDAAGNLQQQIDDLDQALGTHLAESAKKHIKEIGSNSNGHYIIYDDNIAFCWSRQTLRFDTSDQQLFPYPLAFSSESRIGGSGWSIYSPDGGEGHPGVRDMLRNHFSALGTTASSWSIWFRSASPSDYTTATRNVYFFVVGRVDD